MDKFNELPPKEKFLYLLSSAVILTVFYIFVFLFPLNNDIKKSKLQLDNAAKKWTQFQQEIETYRSLPAVSTSEKRSGSILAVLERTAQNTGVKEKLSYLRPFTSKQNKEGAEIKFDNISGDELITFLSSVRNERIKVIKANLLDNDMDSLWTVKLFLEG